MARYNFNDGSNTATLALPRAARADRREAAGTRLSVEHDPAGDCGARRAGRMQMKREPQCLRDASKAFLSLQRVTRKLPQLCKRPACSKSEPRRGLTCIRWGAYGVVGFSGVKDARKSVLIADALASARHLCPESTAACDYWTGTGQKLDNGRPLRP